MNNGIYQAGVVKRAIRRARAGRYHQLQSAECRWRAWKTGKVFKRYRERGGQRHAPLPDFFVGAHAAVEGLTLLTRDAKRYREYFPKLRLIAPRM